MSDRDDTFVDLVRDVAAYAQYLRDLGVEHVGGGLVSVPEPRIVTKQEAPMPSKKEPPPPSLFDAPSLFGSAPAEEAPAVPAVAESLEEIRADIGDCTRCKLHETRRNIVFGEGAMNARLMFVGEGPGADEDASGRPFVGAAGQLLDKIIGAIGLKREDVYIANVVKCRPPGNRKPEKDESGTCEQFLVRQIATIDPKVIVCLGATAMESLLGLKGGITRLRGKFYDYEGKKVMATFHPAYLLRDPTKKREVWEDMKLVRDELAR
jgi:uracil-DNA glycosylase